MSVKPKTIVLFLHLALSWPIQASNYTPNAFDRVQLMIAHSWLLTPLKKAVMALAPLLDTIWHINNEPAATRYQTIGADAQEAVGINPANRVCIKTARGRWPTGKQFHAIATITGIYVNPKTMDSKSYGFTRHVLHHEAIHYKYDDPLLASLLGAASCLIADSTGSKIAQRTAGLHKYNKIIGLICGLGAGLTALKKYHYYAEHRADIQGAYATQCYKCMSELLADYEGDMSQFGYASKKELKVILKKLAQKKIVCAHHALK